MRNGMVALLILLLGQLPGATQDVGDGEFTSTAPPKVQPTGIESVTSTPDDVEAPPTDAPFDEKMEQIIRRYAEEAAEDEASASTDEAALGAESSEDQNAGGLEFAPAFLQGVMALAFTLALFLLLLAALKRWGRRTPLLAGHALGNIMGRIALSPQATLHFVRVRNEVLIVGVTPQSINLLRTLDADLFEAEESESPEVDDRGAEPIDFLAQLQASQESLRMNPVGMDEDLDNLKGDLQRLKQYFQESTRGKE